MIEILSQALSLLLFVSAGLLIYHHLGFPLIMRFLVSRRDRETVAGSPPRLKHLPPMTVVMPAYNEVDFIAGKLRNLAHLDYPERLLRVVLICDGCTDDTAGIARKTAEEDLRGLKLEIIEETENRGKIAVLNRYIPTVPEGIVVLTDVSADLPADSLRRAAVHFENADTGVVAATYKMPPESNAGEKAYWRYQIANKLGESRLGAPLGVHGALYFFRSELFTPLAPDTINDDFILPMQIVLGGHKAIYDQSIIASEREVARAETDFNRRVRISAGNLQQLVRLPGLLSPRLKGTAFSFASGKALRAVAPFLLAFFILGSALMAPLSSPWALVFICEVAGIGLLALRHWVLPAGRSRILDILHYVASGHIAGFIGTMRYLRGDYRTSWKRANLTTRENDMTINNDIFQSTGLAQAKRTIDIIGALMGLTLSAFFVPLICLAIKLDSRGPVVFRQLRVGRSWPTHTELFTMYKFRTMRTDAEKSTGPVWASKNDPRITGVGRFLRKTRLDEIPQLVNVLKGEMSLVGPRPERPGICDKLENEIPFYAERTFGVRPGITGLAQVFQGYDETVEDVRSKVAYDHAYALAAGSWGSWIRIDAEILLRTVTVVLFGRGQ